jgi:hypothetical protein
MKPMWICMVTVLSAAVAGAAVTPNDVAGATDSDRIEAAIVRSLETGERSIEIPRRNARTGRDLWLIERAILLPSDFTLVLRDCLVRLAPGTRDNLIRNAGTTNSPMRGDRSIRILGVGSAVLSGGLEAHFDPPGDKSGWRTIGVLLCGVEHFTIEGFAMEETQAWAVSVENGCAHGRIANLEFRNTNKYPNQDGVDIRKGCRHITIENITGVTGDDAVALTGLRRETPRPGGGPGMQVGGSAPRADDDIHDITIRNVHVKIAGGHHIVRLLNHDGIRLYNVFIRDVLDASGPGDARVAAGLKIGDTRYWSMSQSQPGDTFNVFVDTVLTRGRTAVKIQGPLGNSVLRAIAGYDGCTNLVEQTAPLDNVRIETFPLRSSLPAKP